MKRDMDLVREILLIVESAPCTKESLNVTIPDVDDELVGYQIQIMMEAGLVHCANWSTEAYYDFRPQYLTWEGHEFLDACRDQGRWDKAKEIVQSTGAAVTFVVLKEILVQLMRTAVLGN